MGEMSNPWDDRYTMHTAAFGVEPNDFLVAHAKRIPRDSGPVLCIGDGQGRNGVHLAALRPGGVWIHESYAPGQIGRGTGGPSDPDMLASVAQLRHQLAGLTHLIADELVRPVVEGPLHTGEAEVVQYLGAVGDPRGSDER
jgi:hypothetical protein